MLIVIVNYRTPGLVVDCLRSLADEIATLRGVRVQVVDNASADGSVEALREAIKTNGWGSWASILRLQQNDGFASGNNAAIRSLVASGRLSRYVLLLNPDTIVKSRALHELREFMDANPDVGIAGARLENASGQVQRSAHRKPTPLGELEVAARLGVLSTLLAHYVVSPPVRGEIHGCDWVSGAAMMVRREVFEQVGLLDDRYFLYFEEVDLCVRARQRGWQICYVPTSHVVHLEGSATGARGNCHRSAYWLQSRQRFFVKHYSMSGLILADILWFLGRVILYVRQLFRLAKVEANEPSCFARDLLCGDIMALLTGRLSMEPRGRTSHA
jgi:N-acetylglucosaminyl-diphospho-decaprenol L-rhamnosyltransferase